MKFLRKLQITCAVAIVTSVFSWIAIDGHAGSGVVRLSDSQMANIQVAGAGERCSAQTTTCPSAGAGTASNCGLQNGVNCGNGFCYECSAPGNARKCVTHPEATCTDNGEETSPCGFSKNAGCQFVGGVCRCKPIPAEFSGDYCPLRDCTGDGA